MGLVQYAAAYGGICISFVILDAIWLRIMLPKLYAPVIGGLLTPTPRFGPAAIFYLGYPLGLLMFAVAPEQDGTAAKAFLNGAMFGMFTYATYNLTNHATLKKWSTMLSVTDVTWGSVLAGSSAFFGHLVMRRVLGA
jgi:uncharacterized membrane protein